MYCVRCGAENPEDNLFCEICGAKLEGNVQDSETDLSNTANSVKKIVIGGVVGIAVAVLIATAAVSYIDGKKKEKDREWRAKYDTMIEDANECVEALDYETAEDIYTEAIGMRPNDTKAYIKLSDMYVKQNKYEEASALLQQGNKHADSQEIEKKLKQITPHLMYRDYVKNTLIPKNGIVEVDRDLTYTSIGSGLISTMLEDFDGDSELEMLVVSYGDSTATDIEISIYEILEGEVRLSSEINRTYRDGVDDLNADASKFNVFVKRYDGKNFLIIGGGILKEKHKEGLDGYGAIDVFRIADVIEEVSTMKWHIAPEMVSYSVKDTEVAYYSSYTSLQHDEDLYDAQISIGVDSFIDEMSLFGFEKERVRGVADGSYSMALSYDQDDDTESPVCCIVHGIYDKNGEVDMTDGGITRCITDYTGLRDWVAQ